MRIVPILFLLAPLLVAQTVPDASISGIVRDKGTGQPLANFNVYTDTHARYVGNLNYSGKDSKHIESKTDANGRYRLSGLPADHYVIIARDSQGRTREDFRKNIVLSGHDIDNVNIDASLDGSIEGKVVDENGDPVQGLMVQLVTREYFHGKVGYYERIGRGQTNDRGEYHLTNVVAGRAYLVLADSFRGGVVVQSEAPLVPQLRRPVVRLTWYPNSTSGDGAAEIVVRQGEVRQAVNIAVKKATNFCIEGTTRLAGTPAAMTLEIEATQPSGGLSNRGGSYGADVRIQTGIDGAFRVCNLFPGDWRVTTHNLFSVRDGGGKVSFGTTTVTIRDEDVKDLSVDAQPGSPLSGEIVLDGDAPQKPLDAQVALILQAMFRSNMGPGDQNQGYTIMPGTFTIPSVLTDDYAVRALSDAPGFYVKSIQYQGQSVQNSVVHVAGGGNFRVVIGLDAASLAVSVADKKGDPVQDTNVVIVPAGVSSEAALAADFVSGRTDQAGQYTAANLKPGKYYVAATADSFDATVSDIAKLWNSYKSFQLVELAPNGQGQANLVFGGN